MNRRSPQDVPTQVGGSTGGSPDFRALLESVHEDQRARWQRGDRVRAETLLEMHPRLRSNPAMIVDLLYHEYLLGHELGDGPELDDFAARFPEYTKALVRQVSFGETLRGDGDSLAPIRPRVPERIGRFPVQGEIGRGRFGVVYAAADPLLNRVVAVKVARQEIASDPTFADRFLREAAAAAGLDHPGIVNVYEVGSDGESLFYVMELCEGSDLAEWLADQGGIVPPRLAAELVRQVAEAVESAHANGLVHRDLKPANLMISRRASGPGDESPDEPDWRVRVLDFGLARSLQDELSDTRSSMILGTPLYMAPEMTGRGRGDARTDVFSIGAILYELLTGHPPFAAKTVPAVLERLRTCEATPPRRLRPEIDRDVETICSRCLRRDPEDRYQSAGAVAEDLQRYLDGMPPKGRKVGWLDRLSSWSRHPDRNVELGMVVIALSLLLIVWPLAMLAFGTSMSGIADEMSAAQVASSWFFVCALVTPPHFVSAGIGLRTMRGLASHGMLWVGFLINGGLTLFTLLILLAIVPSASTWYEQHPLARQFIHTGLLLALFAQSLAFVVLLRARGASVR